MSQAQLDVVVPEMLVETHAGPAWVVPAEGVNDYSNQTEPKPGTSWPFLWLHRLSCAVSDLFGLCSVIFLLAAAANVPLMQFASFGYLLAVSGRIASDGRLRSGMIGVRKAGQLGGLLLGSWLLILPVRYVAVLWQDAWLIDPSSPQTSGLKMATVTLAALAVGQIVAAWMCGGKLRYFFWPLLAPFSFGIWLLRKAIGLRPLRQILEACLNLASPKLVSDLGNVKPPGDWFVPAILWRQMRTEGLYAGNRDRFWDYLSSLNLWGYWRLGFVGFVGTLAWLAIPTILMIASTADDQPINVLFGLFGIGSAIPVFALLPFVQAHYARDGSWRRFTELRAVLSNFRRAPLAHVTSQLLMLLLALPLFALKIEPIPTELLWTLSIVFVLFAWPSRVAAGWAYHRGERGTPGRFWIRYPLMSLAIPFSLAFLLIFFLTRYTSWNGAWSTLENHLFLLPAPFWWQWS